MASADETPLYDRIGGSGAIEAAIDAFYERVLEDNRVDHFFDGMDIDRIKRQQQRFFEFGTGGPGEYDVDRIELTHTRLGIDETAYEVFVGHFEDTLVAFEVPERERGEIMDAVNSFRDDVITVD